MVKIVLERAENGVVKLVEDDNANGAGEIYESKRVYELDKDSENSFSRTIEFLCDTLNDLGIDTGNKFSQETLTFGTEWGSHYNAKESEIKDRIRNLKAEINILKEMLNNRNGDI